MIGQRLISEEPMVRCDFLRAYLLSRWLAHEIYVVPSTVYGAQLGDVSPFFPLALGLTRSSLGLLIRRLLLQLGKVPASRVGQDQVPRHVAF
jgi:hypothetical protein